MTAAIEFERDRRYRLRWWTLAVLSVSLLIIIADDTIINVALPTLAQAFGGSASSLQWVVDAYIPAFGSLLLTMGTLGDRFGRRLPGWLSPTGSPWPRWPGRPCSRPPASWCGEGSRPVTSPAGGRSPLPHRQVSAPAEFSARPARAPAGPLDEPAAPGVARAQDRPRQGRVPNVANELARKWYR